VVEFFSSFSSVEAIKRRLLIHLCALKCRCSRPRIAQFRCSGSRMEHAFSIAATRCARTRQYHLQVAREEKRKKTIQVDRKNLDRQTKKNKKSTNKKLTAFFAGAIVFDFFFRGDLKEPPSQPDGEKDGFRKNREREKRSGVSKKKKKKRIKQPSAAAESRLCFSALFPSLPSRPVL
jgi:hypothetical protein